LKSIVIVDDEKDLCNLFTEVLQKNGYNVLGFLDPIQALVHIQANPNQYCLLISDFRMPNLNGYELCTKLIKLNPKLQVILMTAYDTIEYDTSKFTVVKKPILIA
jgi:DNA-binding NtrC family response regulator